MKIKKIDAFQVFDSRGTPTIEAVVELSDNTTGRAIVPSGASTGIYEALELRDHNKKKFRGLSVYKAIENIQNIIGPALVDMNAEEQKKLDLKMVELDGTKNKNRLGANAILSVSMALARAAANRKKIPLFKHLADSEVNNLPLPEIQIIGGGAHSAGRIDIQDFMVVCTGAASYMESLEMTFNIYRKCGKILKKRGILAGVADEGGYWPEFSSNEMAFDIILNSIEAAGYKAGTDVHLSLDIAASEFYTEGDYHLRLENKILNSQEFYNLITRWCASYPIISIEDPFSELDTDNWKKFTSNYGKQIQIVGDDLFCTNSERVKSGWKENLANSVLIKLNQVGTVTETIDCIKQTQSYGWLPIVSARSGETEDPFISHLAVATNTGQLKVGSFTRSERMVKWNEIIRIERILGKEAQFRGGKLFQSFLNQ